MRQTMTAFFIILALCGGCGSSTSGGREIKADQITKIKKGQTTEADLIRLFGKPASRIVDSEGQVQLTWQFMHLGMSPFAMFFPTSSSVDYRAQGLSVTIGKDGTVQHYMMSDSNPETTGK